MRRNNDYPIEEISRLSGDYESYDYHSCYIEDTPPAKPKRLKYGKRITSVTRKELDGLLYNLNIMAMTEPEKAWTREQIAEFCHYVDFQKLNLLLRFLSGNGYVHFKEKKHTISHLQVIKEKTS